MLELAQPQQQKWVRCSTALMFTCREKLSQVPPIPEDYNVMPLPPTNASSPSVVTVYKLTGGGGCLHLSTQPTWPQLYACLVFCLLSFSASPVIPSWVSRASSPDTWELPHEQGPESKVMPGWKSNYGGAWSLRWGEHSPRSAHIRNKWNK
jgi:hypothetical protein